MVLVASVVLASAYSFWSLYTDDHGSFLETGTGPRHASVYRGFLKFVLSFALARFAREIWSIISVVLVLRSPCSVCLGVAYENRNLDFSGDSVFLGNAWFDSGYSLCESFGFWKYFTHFLHCGRLES